MTITMRSEAIKIVYRQAKLQVTSVMVGCTGNSGDSRPSELQGPSYSIQNTRFPCRTMMQQIQNLTTGALDSQSNDGGRHGTHQRQLVYYDVRRCQVPVHDVRIVKLTNAAPNGPQHGEHKFFQGLNTEGISASQNTRCTSFLAAGQAVRQSLEFACLSLM